MGYPHKQRRAATNAPPASFGGLGLRGPLALGLCAVALACTDGALILPGSPAAAAQPVTSEPSQALGMEGTEPGGVANAGPGGAGEIDAPAEPTPVKPPSEPAGAEVHDPDGLGPEGAEPALRGAVALGDAALARQALVLLGSAAVGAEGSCSGCHSLGRPTLTRWLELTQDFTAACLTAPELGDTAGADAMLRCFDRHAKPEAVLAPSTFGVYAAAAHLGWFSFVFDHASGDPATRKTRHDAFVAGVGMPRAGSPWTQEQFDIVAEWFARGLPYSFELVPEDSGAACSAGVDPRLQQHVQLMRQSGWKARNEQAPLLMFGCDGGEAASCLSGQPLASDYFGESWDSGAARSRILYDNTATPTNYWSRGSADGRFMASGLRSGALGRRGQFIDLAAQRRLEADYSYDPTFFPDNSGFLVQRASYSPPPGDPDGAPSYREVAIACNQSVLTGSSGVISGLEPECDVVDAQIGLYQQVAKAVDGDDYWVVFGSFVDDNGGFAPTLDNPAAAFSSQSAVTLTPMLNVGATFEPGAPTRVATPLAGDPMLSPSGRLLVTRLKGRERTTTVGGRTVVKAEQSGYALMLLAAEQGAGATSATLADVGRICLQGGKPALSYDERWMVLHHYVTDDDAVALGFDGPDDPAFAEYRQLGASNLYLVDLLDGTSRAITRMGPGQYALFPHFRSDGWIYFVVRTLDGDELFAASDAAVLLESATGG